MSSKHADTESAGDLRVIHFDARANVTPKSISRARWEQVKPLLEELHHAGYKRKIMLAVLHIEHDFKASLTTLNNQMNQWGFGVYKQPRKAGSRNNESDLMHRKPLQLRGSPDGQHSAEHLEPGLHCAMNGLTDIVESINPIQENLEQVFLGVQTLGLTMPQSSEPTADSTDLQAQASFHMNNFFESTLADPSFSEKSIKGTTSEEIAVNSAHLSNTLSGKQKEVSTADTLSDGVSAMSISTHESWRFSKVTGLPSNPSVCDSISDHMYRDTSRKRRNRKEFLEFDPLLWRNSRRPYSHQTSLEYAVTHEEMIDHLDFQALETMGAWT